MKKTGISGHVYEFSVDYNDNTNYSPQIPFIHNYLMIKYNKKQNVCIY